MFVLTHARNGRVLLCVDAPVDPADLEAALLDLVTGENRLPPVEGWSVRNDELVEVVRHLHLTRTPHAVEILRAASRREHTGVSPCAGPVDNHEWWIALPGDHCLNGPWRRPREGVAWAIETYGPDEAASAHVVEAPAWMTPALSHLSATACVSLADVAAGWPVKIHKPEEV